LTGVVNVFSVIAKVVSLRLRSVIVTLLELDTEPLLILGILGIAAIDTSSPVVLTPVTLLNCGTLLEPQVTF
tara:strand:- start:2523 stop:2738 length:216 start_codon:yes stop_codon:yes gene_type:complete